MFTKKTGGNLQNVLYVIIALLLVVIAVMGFFLGKLSSGTTGNAPSGDGTGVNNTFEEVSIKVIKDDADVLGDLTNEFINSLKELPSLVNAEFDIKKFSDEGIKDFMIQNNIKNLPAFIFSTNNFDTSKDPSQVGPDGNVIPKINAFLVQLPNGEYDLPVGATYDPFVERSDKGFRILTQEQFDNIKKDVYTQGSEEGKITWLEYSDLECPYCAKLYTDGTPVALKDKYKENLNIIFNHYPLSFHANAMDAAEILECLGEQKGSNAFYSLIEKAFADEKSDKAYLIDESVKLGANKIELEKCLSDHKYSSKIDIQMTNGYEIFGVTGTPGNILINNKTLEFEEVGGAQPAQNFEKVIDKLLE